jgi:hypothetical protein
VFTFYLHFEDERILMKVLMLPVDHLARQSDDGSYQGSKDYHIFLGVTHPAMKDSTVVMADAASAGMSAWQYLFSAHTNRIESAPVNAETETLGVGVDGGIFVGRPVDDCVDWGPEIDVVVLEFLSGAACAIEKLINSRTYSLNFFILRSIHALVMFDVSRHFMVSAPELRLYFCKLGVCLICDFADRDIRVANSRCADKCDDRCNEGSSHDEKRPLRFLPLTEIVTEPLEASVNSITQLVNLCLKARLSFDDILKPGFKADYSPFIRLVPQWRSVV